MKVYQRIASLLNAIAYCEKSNNTEWLAKHRETLENVCSNYLPSGSGIDSGTTLESESTDSKLILSTAYHHMDENGYYDGWTQHIVTVRPSFDTCGFSLTISGKNRNDIKDYLHDVFTVALTAECE